MSYSVEILTFITLTVVKLLSILLLYLWRRRQTYRDLPPGPKGLPLIGVLIHPQKMFQTFRDYRKKYGDIVGFHTGRSYMVIVSGGQIIRDVFVRRGEVYSDRPSYILTREFGGNRGR
jgi:hypothetical protein